MSLNVQARKTSQGTVLLLTLMMLVLLTFEVAVISLVSQRGLGNEGILQTQSIAARRGGEVALNQLEENLYNYLRQNGATNVDTDFAFGGSNDLDEAPLQVINPATGSPENSDVNISAWLESRRGIWYHIIARARNKGSDLLMHRWIRVSPCNSNGSGTLSTLLSAVDQPAEMMLDKAADGRIFYGSNSEDVLWTWEKGTGISTIIGGVNDPGQSNMGVAPDGRVFFGADSSNTKFWSWHKDTGLSTILPTSNSWPGLSSTVVGNDGRVYFGEDNNPGTFWTWRKDTGLTTVITGVKWPGTDFEQIIAIHKPTSRVYFGEGNSGAASGTERYWSYHPSTGLSTIVSSGYWPGYGIAREAAPDGRILFGMEGHCKVNGYTCPLLTWKPGVGLSTIATDGFGEPGSHITPDMITSDNRFYFSTWSNGSFTDGFYTWKDGTGLSTILMGWSGIGHYASGGDGNGRIFFVGNGNRMFTYHLSTGLSTIISGVTGIHDEGSLTPDDGMQRAKWVTPSGRIFFGRGTGATTYFWTWHKNTGLSTLLTDTEHMATEGSVGASDNDRVYWGDPDGLAGAARIWTWHKNTGLSTILSNSEKTGKRSTLVGVNGELYMGGTGFASPFIRWEPAPDCSTLGY